MSKVFVLFLLSVHLLFAKTITIGFSAQSLTKYNQKDVRITAEIWIKEIAKELNTKVNVITYETPQEMMRDIKKDKVDYISVSGLDCVKYFDLSYLDNGFDQGFFNGIPSQFIIVVQKKSGIKNILELKNKLIGMQKHDDIIHQYLDVNLADKTNTVLNIETFTSRQRVLLKLFFGKIDAAIVTNKSFELAKQLNPQIGEKLEVLENTNLQATNFGFFRKSFDKNVKKRMTQIVKTIHKTPRGRELLSLYKTEKLSDSNLSDLKAIEELYNQALKIKK